MQHDIYLAIPSIVMNRPSPIVTGLLLLIAATACWGQDKSPRHLPFETVQAICAKYDGQLAMELPNETLKVSCPWVDKLATIKEATLTEKYRAILSSVHHISSLRNAVLPPDLSCGSFEEKATANGRTISCQSNLGDIVPFDFVADKQGRLRFVEIAFNYRKMYSAALQRQVDQGRIKRVHPAYIDLQTDLQVAKLRYTALEGDSVTTDGKTIRLIVIPPAQRQ